MGPEPRHPPLMAVDRHPSMYTSNGRILRVEIHHFLTHVDKVVDFKTPITLIHGQNGSGKSSIIQAIHFAMGGRPELIRDDCTSWDGFRTSSVNSQDNVSRGQETSVTLFFTVCAEGQHRVRAIRRTIKARNANYSVCEDYRNEASVFSRQNLETVEHLLRRMGHFPNNDLTMVSQSRMKVLGQASGADRYAAFMAATGLKSTQEDLRSSRRNIEESYGNLISLTQSYKETKARQRVVRKILKDNSRYRTLMGQKKRLSCVGEAIGTQLTRIGNYQKRLEVQEKRQKLLEKKANIGNLEERMKQIENSKLQLRDDLRVLTTEKEKVESELSGVMRECSLLTNEMNIQKSKLSSLNQHRARLSRYSQTYKENIEHEQRIIESGTPPSFTEVEPTPNPELKDLEREREGWEKDILTLRNEQETLHQSLNCCRRKEQEIDDGLKLAMECKQHKRDEVELHKKTLECIGLSGTMQELCLRSLPRDYQNLYRAIKSVSTRSAVYAPVGAYFACKTTDEDVYKSLSAYLNADILQLVAITDNSDSHLVHQQVRLNNMRNQTILKLSPFRMRTHCYEEISRLISPDLRSLVTPITEYLEFFDDNVLHIVELQHNIMHVLICKNKDAAYRLLTETAASQINPICLIAGKCLKIRRGISGSFITSHIGNLRGRRTFLTNISGNRESTQSKLKAAKKDLEEWERKETQLTQQREGEEYRENARKIKEYEAEREALEKRLGEMGEKTRALTEKIEALMKEDMQKLSDYNLRRRAARNRLDEYKSARRRRDAESQKYNDNEKQIKELEKEMEEVEGSLRDLHQRESQPSRRLAQLRQKEEQIKQQIDAKNEELSRCSVEALAQTREEEMRQAKMMADDIIADEQAFNEREKDISAKLETIFSHLFELDGIENDRYFDADLDIPISIGVTRDVYEREGMFNAVDRLTGVTPDQGDEGRDHLQKLDADIGRKCTRCESITQDIQATCNVDLEEKEDEYYDLTMKCSDLEKRHRETREDVKNVTHMTYKSYIHFFNMRAATSDDICNCFSENSRAIKLQQSLRIVHESVDLIPGYIATEFSDDDLYSQYMDTCGEVWEDVQEPAVHQGPRMRGSIEIVAGVRNIGTFSGGESSFTSISLIVACWKLVKTAYAQIDEWDVFMDATRRREAFKQLVNVLKDTNIQCVLVTPNDVELERVDQKLHDLISVIYLDAIRPSDQ
ncbi:SMC6 protein [Giardia muris]|uniref:SMC6 protein n=1 Tax=Giardia muris TaxID=5742 RepID=A0A4Z1SLF3_GIAMU|nr:SMC6 protein [Giardia muris]|eukprot:TNJ26472.1 SMC6 protein [Giardia muris]